MAHSTVPSKVKHKGQRDNLGKSSLSSLLYPAHSKLCIFSLSFPLLIKWEKIRKCLSTCLPSDNCSLGNLLSFLCEEKLPISCLEALPDYASKTGVLCSQQFLFDAKKCSHYSRFLKYRYFGSRKCFVVFQTKRTNSGIMCTYHQLNKVKSAELFVYKSSDTAKTCPMINR